MLQKWRRQHEIASSLSRFLMRAGDHGGGARAARPRQRQGPRSPISSSPDRQGREAERPMPTWRISYAYPGTTRRYPSLERRGTTPPRHRLYRQCDDVRHAKGPIYQSHLLTYLGVRQVDAVITPQQTPLERVREIGAALGVQINSQQPAQLQRAVRSLERPILPPVLLRAKNALPSCC